MYLLNSFQIPKNEVVNEWVGEGRGGHVQKSTKKCHEINKISTLTSPNNSLQNAMKVEIFFNVTLNYWTLVLTKALSSIQGLLQVGPQFG